MWSLFEQQADCFDLQTGVIRGEELHKSFCLVLQLQIPNNHEELLFPTMDTQIARHGNTNTLVVAHDLGTRVQTQQRLNDGLIMLVLRDACECHDQG